MESNCRTKRFMIVNSSSLFETSFALNRWMFPSLFIFSFYVCWLSMIWWFDDGFINAHVWVFLKESISSSMASVHLIATCDRVIIVFWFIIFCDYNVSVREPVWSSYFISVSQINHRSCSYWFLFSGSDSSSKFICSLFSDWMIVLDSFILCRLSHVQKLWYLNLISILHLN